MRVFLILLLFWRENSLADEKGYAQGQSFARDNAVHSPADPSRVPGYEDPSSFASGINEKTIDHAAQKASQNSPEADLLRKTYNTRPRFDLDIKTDSLFTAADTVVLNPEKALNLQGQTKVLTQGKSQHTCTKGYDLIERKCKWRKVPLKTGEKEESKEWVVNLLRQQMS